eukprot:732457-Pleurochrysis_carterae.AAC.1
MDDELGKVIFIAKSGTIGFLYVLVPDVGIGHCPEGGLRAMDKFDAAMLAVKAEEKLKEGEANADRGAWITAARGRKHW